jgi:hypothetical protein
MASIQKYEVNLVCIFMKFHRNLGNIISQCPLDNCLWNRLQLGYMYVHVFTKLCFTNLCFYSECPCCVSVP